MEVQGKTQPMEIEQTEEKGSVVKKVAFLSKKQREELRLQKLAQQNEQIKQFQEVCQESKKMYEEVGSLQPEVKKEMKEPVKKKKKDSDNESNRSGSRSRSRQKEKKEKKTKAPKLYTSEEIEKIQKEELEKAKRQYLGLNKIQRRDFRHSEKYRNSFNFEWEDKEDTSQLGSSLYANQNQPTLLFGKGLMAGIDVAQQRSQGNPSGYISKYDKMMEHWSTKKQNEMTERDWRIFREDNNIITKGGRVPNPIRSWDEAKIDLHLLDAIKRMGFKIPKPIQMQAIPIGLGRKDMIALAPTGQGKTLAYLIPLISYIGNLPPITHETANKGPYGLILAPARQLAQQISQQFEKLTLGIGCRSQTVVGGKKIEFQGLNLQQGCQVLIGTPGRIRQLLEKHYVVLTRCSWVIIDEADKMIDMDMEPDVNFILDSVGSLLKSQDEEIAEEEQRNMHLGDRQYRVSHLFSATMPLAIQKLAKKYLRSFCYISIGEPGSGKKDIQHFIEIIDESQKKHFLGKTIKQLKAPIILFVKEKRSCEILKGVLAKWGRSAIEYHGGKSQQARQDAIKQFKAGKYEVLIATDLAGRGLHVDGVTAVINFDAPKSINDYIHRTGRTGRAGKKGVAYTFLTSNDEIIFYDLKEFLTKNEQEIPAELDNHPASKIKPGTIAQSVPRRKQILYAQ